MNALHHINKGREKYITVSIDRWKAFDKIQNPFFRKTLKIGSGRKLLHMIEGFYKIQQLTW